MQERLTVSDEIKVSSVPMDQVLYVWSSQIDMIERGMSRGQADWGSAEDLLDQVLRGSSQLWVVHRGEEVLAVVVFCVRSNEFMTKLFIQLLAGRDMPSWINFQSMLQDFAELIGADCIEASCRPGLAKFLKNHGWKQKAIIMELK
jgi:hypothetical protein